ncbi:hypothetical protein MTR67_043790, partial [Solanum verrucosum]
KNDLDLGEGHQLSIITDMQKGLEIAVENVLSLVEHRKCARHVLANWCKNWKGVERRRVFWRIAKCTFEAEMKDNIQEMKKLGQECLDDLLWYNYMVQEPMNNMKMWQTSNNSIVKPPKIKKLLGRPGKVRRKEADESRKTGKLSKRGAAMTCSKCGTQGHNKRGCPTRNQVGPSQSTEPSSQAQTINGRGRGRGRGTGTDRGSGTGRGKGIPQERNVNEGLGRGRGMTQHSQTSSEATCSGRGLERGKRPVEPEDTSEGQTRSFKRPRMVGVGIYQVEAGFTTLNHGLPSRRVINTSTRVTKRVDVVTGDIGYTPVRGFKWKGKTTITSSNLDRMRAEKVIQTRSAVATTANSQSQTTSSRKTSVPWK